MALTKVNTRLINNDSASVLDFGVKGDGVTDDYQALQQALNSGVSELFFPEGTYLTSETLRITSKISLKGDGKIKETVVLDNTLLITADEVSIDGLTFEGAETTEIWVNYPYEERNKVLASSRKSIIKTSGVQGCSFSNIKMSGKRQGMMINDSLRCHFSDIQFVGLTGAVGPTITATEGQTDFTFDKPVNTANDIIFYIYTADGTTEKIYQYERPEGNTSTSMYTYLENDYVFLEDLPSSDGVTIRLAEGCSAGDRVFIQYDVLFIKPNVITGVQLNGGGQHLLNSIRGAGTGQVILTGASSSDNVVTNVVGYDIHDNGIYNSSGNHNKYIGGVFERSTGSGVKLRGSGNHASGFSILDVSVGISITGALASADNLGSSAFGSSVSDNYIASARRVGIEINQAYSYYSRSVTIDNNIIEASKMVDSGSYAPIRVLSVRDCKVTNNTIRGYECTHAIYMGGYQELPSGEFRNHVNSEISNNTISDGIRGLTVLNGDGCLISNNTFYNLSSNTMDLLNVNDSFVMGNKSSTSIYLSNLEDYICSGTTVSNNVCASVTGDYALCSVQQEPPQYEYQAFTPFLTIDGQEIPNANYNNQHGWTTRIGRTVHFQGRLSCDLSAGLDGLTGVVKLEGLPFTSGNTSSGNYSAVTLGRVQRWNTNGNPTNAWIDRNDSTVYLSKRNESLFPDDVNAPTVLLTDADLDVTSGYNNEIMFSGMYFVDA